MTFAMVAITTLREHLVGSAAERSRVPDSFYALKLSGKALRKAGTTIWDVRPYWTCRSATRLIDRGTGPQPPLDTRPCRMPTPLEPPGSWPYRRDR